MHTWLFLMALMVGALELRFDGTSAHPINSGTMRVMDGGSGSPPPPPPPK